MTVVLAYQCFIVARLTHDYVLEPQTCGETIFVNNGDSRVVGMTFAFKKRQRSSFACSAERR